jgi:hypothetical protein
MLLYPDNVLLHKPDIKVLSIKTRLQPWTYDMQMLFIIQNSMYPTVKFVFTLISLKVNLTTNTRLTKNLMKMQG